MNSAVLSPVRGDPAAILDRQATRRTTGLPTVSLLVGPIGAGLSAWRRWAAARGLRAVVASANAFPVAEWVRSAALETDLPAAAVHCLAQRSDRDPNELLAAWQAKAPADRERFSNNLAPKADDDLLQVVASLAVGRASPSTVAASLGGLGERIVPVIVRLGPSADWPGVLFLARSADDFLAAGREAVKWAMQVPTLSLAVTVPAVIWDEYLATAPESRTKALLKEGELAIPAIDAATAEQVLTEAGVAKNAVAMIAANGADPALLESAVAAVRATAAPPQTRAEGDRARSAAERFLFTFLESLPETAGRFELNGALDFEFGPRAAEVDLLCRSPRIAIELDGYFHFLAPDGYRRDRLKDWELQRRGFIVLRFLAEDVIPQLEIIRDRVLAALNLNPFGART
jgi:Protein of unknown function (DUF559)